MALDRPIKTGRGRRYAFSGIFTIENIGRTTFNGTLGFYEWNYFGSGIVRAFFPDIGFWFECKTTAQFDPLTGQPQYLLSMTPHSGTSFQGRYTTIRRFTFPEDGVAITAGPFPISNFPSLVNGFWSMELDVDEWDTMNSYPVPFTPQPNWFTASDTFASEGVHSLREFPRTGGTAVFKCGVNGVINFSKSFVIPPFDAHDPLNLGGALDYVSGMHCSVIGSNSPGHASFMVGFEQDHQMGEIDGAATFDNQIQVNFSNGARSFLAGTRSNFNDLGTVYNANNPDFPTQCMMWQKPPKRWALNGKIFAWNEDYQKTLRVDWYSRLNAPPIQIFSPNTFTANDTQHYSFCKVGFVTARQTQNGGFLTKIDEYSPIIVKVDPAGLTAAGEDPKDQRIPFFGPQFQPYTLAHDETYAIAVGDSSNWAADEFGVLTSEQPPLTGVKLDATLGTAAMQRSWPTPGINLEAYRYMRFSVVGNGQDDLPFTIRIGQKEWDASADRDGAPAVVEIDLCCPDRILADMPLERDSKFPADSNGRAATEARLSGIDSLLIMRLYGIEINCSLELRTMECFRKSDPVVSFIIPYSFEYRYTPAQQYLFCSRKVLAVVDGKQALEIPWYTVLRIPGQTAQFTGIGLIQMVDLINAVPGWHITPAAGSPNPGYDDTRSAGTWGGDDGFLGAVNGTLGIFEQTTDFVLNAGEGTINCQLNYDMFDAYPGCGDVSTGIGYDSDSDIVARFAKVYRGVTHGMVIDGDAFKPVQFAQIVLEDEKDLSLGGSGTTFLDGFFQTAAPYMKGLGTYDVSVNAVLYGAPVVTVTRKKHRVGAETRPVGGDDLALLRCKPGYFIAYTQDGKLFIKRAWNEHVDFDLTVTIDEHKDCSEPRLEWFQFKQYISILYRRGAATTDDPYTIWRKTSFDHAETWLDDPLDGGAYATDMLHARERFLPRTKERALFYMDNNKVVSVQVFSAQEVSQGVFPISATPADHTSFDADVIDDGAGVDVAMFVDGTIKRFRSYEDCRSWVVV